MPPFRHGVKEAAEQSCRLLGSRLPPGCYREGLLWIRARPIRCRPWAPSQLLEALPPLWKLVLPESHLPWAPFHTFSTLLLRVLTLWEWKFADPFWDLSPRSLLLPLQSSPSWSSFSWKSCWSPLLLARLAHHLLFTDFSSSCFAWRCSWWYFPRCLYCSVQFSGGERKDTNLSCHHLPILKDLPPFCI